MEIGDGALFCPRCGTANPPTQSVCLQCGQDLRLVASALERRHPLLTRRYGVRQLRRQVAVGTLVVLGSLAAVGGWWQWNQVQTLRAQTEVQASHYLNGIWAADVERWDLAATEFGAAGEYRDAPQRRRDAEARLGQVEERYAQALLALKAGQPWQAAYDLNQVVSALPQFRDAADHLTEIRATLGPVMLFEKRDGQPSRALLSSADGGEQRTIVEGEFVASGEFASDGEAAFLEVVRDEQNDLWLFHPEQEERQLLVSQARDAWGRFSPDGRWLLFGWWDTTGWQLSMIPAQGGNITVILRHADFVTGGFSPTGQVAHFWERRGDDWTLGLIPATGDEPVTLVEGADELGDVQWSPDGARVAFRYTREGRVHLEMATPDGTDQYPLAPKAEVAWVRFSPASEQMLLWQWEDRVGVLSLTDLRGKVLRELDRGAADGWAEWSPDSRQVVYGLWNGRTWRVILDRGAGKSLVTLADGVEDARAIFAPGGRWLLLSLWAEGTWRLVLRDLEQGSERVLVGDATFASAIFAPDNQHLLVWYLTSDTEGATLAVANAQTGRRIALAQRLLAAQGGFSADGTTLGVALQFLGGARPSASMGSVDGSTFLEFAPASYRLHWARAAFLFGPRPPEPVEP